jgi:hypothetical protein
MYIGPHVMYPLFFQGLMELYFDIFSKNSKISNLIKIRRVGAEFYADRQTDTDGNDETNNRFSQFCARA